MSDVWSKIDTGSSTRIIYISGDFHGLSLPGDIEYMSAGSTIALARGIPYRFTVVNQEYEETSWSDIPWDEMQEYLDDAQSGGKSPSREITYIISEKVSIEEYGKQIYEMLKADKYNREPYQTKDLNEGMVLIWEWGYMGGPKVMCPLYLVNHNENFAYPIVNTYPLGMLYFKKDDIDWDSLKSIETEREIIHNYKERLGNTTYDDYKGTAFGALEIDFWHNEELRELIHHTLSIEIGKFKNGIAPIIWQYEYYHVFECKEISLHGVIDDKAQIVRKFSVDQIENDD